MSIPPDSRRSWFTRRSTWAIAWTLWFTALTILSSMSHPGPEIKIDGIDKVEHAVFFAIGGTCLALCLAFRGSATAAREQVSPDWKKIALIVILTGALVGWVDEWHQTFTPGRFGLDVYDWCADVFGSSLAVLCARPIHRRLARPKLRT
jgi:VanZ family protein